MERNGQNGLKILHLDEKGPSNCRHDVFERIQNDRNRKYRYARGVFITESHEVAKKKTSSKSVNADVKFRQISARNADLPL